MSVYARDSNRIPPGVKLDCNLRCVCFSASGKWLMLASTEVQSCPVHAKKARSGSGGRHPLILKQNIDEGQGSASRRGSTID